MTDLRAQLEELDALVARALRAGFMERAQLAFQAVIVAVRILRGIVEQLEAQKSGQ